MMCPTEESCSIREFRVRVLRTVCKLCIYIKRPNDMLNRGMNRTKKNLTLRALMCTSMDQLEQMKYFFQLNRDEPYVLFRKGSR